jgi:pyruvate formate lyase activating enzyme
MEIDVTISIRGFLETSLLDWDGKISSVLFLQGCNFRCPFCHNGHLIPCEAKESIPMDGVLEFLEAKQGWIDGVVISGGEPTIHPELPEFIDRLRAIGMKIKLDTNGYEPEVLRNLIDANKLDYVAMDYKAPLDDRYREATGLPQIDLARIRASLDLLREDKVDYELRTTLCPAFVDEEGIEKMAKAVEGFNKMVLQPFEPRNAFNKEVRAVKPFTEDTMLAMVGRIVPYVGKAWLRGRQVVR